VLINEHESVLALGDPVERVHAAEQVHPRVPRCGRHRAGRLAREQALEGPLHSGPGDLGGRRASVQRVGIAPFSGTALPAVPDRQGT
jgi:hypothetical protein